MKQEFGRSRCTTSANTWSRRAWWTSSYRHRRKSGFDHAHTDPRPAGTRHVRIECRRQADCRAALPLLERRTHCRRARRRMAEPRLALQARDPRQRREGPGYLQRDRLRLSDRREARRGPVSDPAGTDGWPRSARLRFASSSLFLPRMQCDASAATSNLLEDRLAWPATNCLSGVRAARDVRLISRPSAAWMSRRHFGRQRCNEAQRVHNAGGLFDATRDSVRIPRWMPSASLTAWTQIKAALIIVLCDHVVQDRRKLGFPTEPAGETQPGRDFSFRAKVAYRRGTRPQGLAWLTLAAERDDKRVSSSVRDRVRTSADAG